MRSIVIGAILALLLTSPAALAKDYVDVPPELIYSSADERYSHLAYFGFFASAMRQWNFTEYLSPVTNVTWVELPKIEDVIIRVREAADNDVKVALHVQPFIFDTGINLKPGYYQTLIELESRLAEEGLTEHIAMVYPIDEPFLRASNSETNSRGKIYNQLLIINEELGDLFPGIPIGVIFNNKEVIRSNFKIPDGYGWIGFDCYENMYDCKGAPFTHYYSVLLENMTEDQMLMAVPQTWVKYSDYEQADWEPDFFYEERLKTMVTDLKKRLRHHYEVALSEPRFVAFIPFIWSFEPAPGKPQTAGFGADRFETMFVRGGEEFVGVLLNIGELITSDNYGYPNLRRSQTEFSILRPPNRYAGKIIDLSETGIISAWSWNKTLAHKSLRMQVVVYQNEAEIYRSGVRRSFILDDSLAFRTSPNLPVVGVHGYRSKLPPEILDEVIDNGADLTIRIYGDGSRLGDYLEIRQ
ncbi:MAG: hypothetical protein V7746_00025 [Halioglobus sp.]